MSDAEFWSIVSWIKWTTPPDWAAVRASLLVILKPLQAEGLWWTFRRKMQELDRVVNEWEMEHNVVFPLDGEDRVDLLSFIVGLGKDDYYAAFKMPEIVVSRAKRSDFVPGILTAIPSASDYSRGPL